MNTIRLLFCLNAFLPIILNAQSARLSGFSVVKIDYDASLVQWTMAPGATCFRMEVQHSVDALNFSTIYTYPGVCGDLNEESHYSWADVNAKPYALNYYRMKLAETEFSSVVVVDLDSDLAGDELQLFPNPARELVQLIIRNPNREDFKLRLFDSEGRLLFNKKFSGRQSLSLDLEDYKSGLYYVEIDYLNSTQKRAKSFVISK